MTFRDFIIYTVLVIFVLYITKVNNMWGVSKGTKRAREDVRVEKSKAKKRKRWQGYMENAIKFDSFLGSGITNYKANKLKYKIDRLSFKVRHLDRNYKPSELSGVFKALQVFGVFLAVILYVLSPTLFSLIPLLLLGTPWFFDWYATSKITEEDKLLEEAFPDLYTVLYTRLIQGTSASLSPTLKDFLVSQDSIRNRTKSADILKQFVLDFRNNIEIYGDEGKAVMKLREKYNSAMMVNFTNLAVQALNGVDNKDKLLSYKIELNNKKKALLEARADKLVNNGKRAIIVVYIILFQFVLLSWYAKFTQTGI